MTRVAVVLTTSIVAMIGIGDPGQAPSRFTPFPAAVRQDGRQIDATQAAIARIYEEVRTNRDGALQIANHRYRVSFSKADGVVFTPRIDGIYDARLTWRYRARSIESDTSRVPLDRVEPIVSRVGDHVVDFERPGVIERYIGEQAGVEQVFVLTERPPGRGDVRIRGDVQFAGSHRSAGDTVEFSVDGLLPLSYSKPIAFDAGNRPLLVRTEVQDNRLDLVLDAATLETARFPVTIDPHLGAGSVYGNGDTNGLGHYTDVAYNWDRAEFLVVFDVGTVASNYQNQEIRAKRYYDHGEAVASSFAIAGSSIPGTIKPRVAFDLHTDRYLVVWQENSQVRGRLLSSTGALLGSELVFGVGVRPAVAARNFKEHTASEVCFAVAWFDSATETIRRSYVRSNGTVAGPAQVNTTALQNVASPSVAYDPHADRFLVVWQDGATRARALVPTSITIGPPPVETVVTSTFPASGNQANAEVTFDPASKKYLVVMPGGGSYRGFFLSSASTPSVINEISIGLAVTTTFPDQRLTSSPGELVLLYNRSSQPPNEARYKVFKGNGTGTSWRDEHTYYGALRASAGAFSQNGFFFRTHPGFSDGTYQTLFANGGRWWTHYVHGRSGDFDGDGRADLFNFRLNPNQVFVKTQFTTVSHTLAQTGIPVLVDIDGDGRADTGTWNPATGSWSIRVTASGQTQVLSLGRGGDIPVPGDYFGSGSDQVAVFRQSEGKWYIGAPPQTQVAVPFGQVGDVPVPADWNGDGDIELGVWRPSTGTWLAAEVDSTPVPIYPFQFGLPGDIPLSGNFVGNSAGDLVLYRPSNAMFYALDGSSAAQTSLQFPTGFISIPMPLDWDGDGLLNFAVYLPGGWYIANSGGTTVITFGQPADIPAGGR